MRREHSSWLRLTSISPSPAGALLDRGSKVDQDGSPCLDLHQHIPRLEVAVANTTSMAVPDSKHYLSEEELRAPLPHRPTRPQQSTQVYNW